MDYYQEADNHQDSHGYFILPGQLTAQIGIKLIINKDKSHSHFQHQISILHHQQTQIIIRITVLFSQSRNRQMGS